MKILVICQHYYPEPFRITDICEELVQMGHKVTVVTGTPNYPLGEIYSGYENGKLCDEVRNGVVIHRCKTIPRKTGTLNRVLNYFSFPYYSKRYIRTLSGDFDVVFANQLSPVMMADAAVAYKRRHKKPMVLYCLDLWPESLCVGGIKKNSVIYKLFKHISARIYRSADNILITSRMFREYLSGKLGIPEEKIHYLPQYAETQFLELPEKEPKEDFNLLFAGNIGVAQNTETIIGAARILKNEPIKFHFVGDGIEVEKIKKLAGDLPNVIFHGRKPLEAMPEYYNMADAMLVTLNDDPVISLTLPGKVQTYMAAGRPIVGAINGETALVLQAAQGGYCGPSGDSEILAENINKLISSENKSEIGRQNREYYLSHFDKRVFMRGLVEKLGEN